MVIVGNHAQSISDETDNDTNSSAMATDPTACICSPFTHNSQNLKSYLCPVCTLPFPVSYSRYGAFRIRQKQRGAYSDKQHITGCCMAQSKQTDTCRQIHNVSGMPRIRLVIKGASHQRDISGCASWFLIKNADRTRFNFYPLSTTEEFNGGYWKIRMCLPFWGLKMIRQPD